MEKLKLTRAGQPVLHQRDALGQIDLLGQPQPGQRVGLGRRRDPGRSQAEGSFLQVAGGGSAVGLPADPSSLRVGGVRRDAHGAQGGGAGDPHMA